MLQTINAFLHLAVIGAWLLFIVITLAIAVQAVRYHARRKDMDRQWPIL